MKMSKFWNLYLWNKIKLFTYLFLYYKYEVDDLYVGRSVYCEYVKMHTFIYFKYLILRIYHVIEVQNTSFTDLITKMYN